MTLPQDFIGVDIAKIWIDVFHLSSSKHERIPVTKRVLSKFAQAAIIVCQRVDCAFEIGQIHRGRWRQLLLDRCRHTAQSSQE